VTPLTPTCDCPKSSTGNYSLCSAQSNPFSDFPECQRTFCRSSSNLGCYCPTTPRTDHPPSLPPHWPPTKPQGSDPRHAQVQKFINILSNNNLKIDRIQTDFPLRFYSQIFLEVLDYKPVPIQPNNNTKPNNGTETINCTQTHGPLKLPTRNLKLI